MTCSDLFVEKAFAGAPLDHCLVIDAHGHWGWENRNFPFPDASVESTIAAMDRMGIDLFCASAIASCYGRAEVGNRTVAEAVARRPDRFFGYMMADVGYRDRIMPQLERCWEAGFRGVKIHSSGGAYDHENYGLIFAFANERRLPVLAHTWGPELDLLEKAIGKYPDINWLMGHSGAAEVDKYIRFGRDYPSVFLETCFSVCPRGLIEQFVEAGLADKLIWGSDSHFMGAEQQIGRVVFAQIDPADKEKILGLNAKRALRL